MNPLKGGEATYVKDTNIKPSASLEKVIYLTQDISGK